MRALLTLLLAGALLLLVLFVAENDPRRVAWTPAFAAAVLLVGLLAAALLASLLLYGGRRRLVQNLWLAVLSAGCSGLLADHLLNRWFDVASYARVVRDPIRHHRLEEHVESVLHSRDFHVRMRTNGLGLRGAPPLPEDRPRLLVLGDSFVMGEGVTEEETAVSQIEVRLRASLGPRLRVLNGGVDSYTPLLSWLLLRELRAQLRPDVVLLAIDMSDLMQEQYYRSIATRDARGDIRSVPNPRAGRDAALALDEAIQRHLYVLRLVYLRVRERLNAGRPQDLEALLARRDDRLLLHTLAADPLDRTAAWDDLFDSVDRIHALCREIGARFFVVLYPWGHQVAPQEWQPGRTVWMPADAVASEAPFAAVRERCRARGLDLIDLVDAFRGAAGGAPLYFRHDMHFTPAGHRRFGAEVARRLEEALRAPHAPAAGGAR